MTRSLVIIFLLLALAAYPTQSFSAEAPKIRATASIYADESGGGLKLPDGVACTDKSIVVVADTGNSRLIKYVVQDGVVSGGQEIKVSEVAAPVRVQVNSTGDIFVLDERQPHIIRLSVEGMYKGAVTPAGVPAPEAFVPRSFKIDSSDNIYILDIFGSRILVINQNSAYVRHVPLPAGGGFFSDLAVDSRGTIYVIDTINAVIYTAAKEAAEFSALTKELKEYMNFPTSMAVDSGGRIFLSDQNGSAIAMVGQDGSFQGRQSGYGWKEGLLRYPSQLCINQKGELFVADRNNSRVQLFTLVK